MNSITRRQYLISSTRREIPHMREILLSCGAYLYIGAGLNMRSMEDVLHRKYIVLGNAFCTDVPDRNIEASVAEFDGLDLNELVRGWTGRWLIVAQSEIQIDATGLMSAFYTTGDAWCISSSLALIASIEGKTPKGKVSDRGLTWQLLPRTLVDGVQALLCTQKMVISGKKLSIVFNPWIENRKSLYTEEKVKRISENLRIAIRNIEKYSGRDIWIALTAGKDSRLVLAAALAAGVSFSTYNAEHDNMSSADRSLPRKLARDFGFSHRFISLHQSDRTKIDEYERFTAGNSRGADEQFYARRQFEAIPKNAIVIRGGLFEAGQRFARTTAGAELENFRSGIEAYYRADLSSSNQSVAFAEWLRYVELNPIPFLDIRDRMYIEQRVGGWAAAIEQSLDLNDWISIQIANSRDLLSLLLCATDEERNGLMLSYDTISILKPELCRYPFNMPSLVDRIRIVKNGLSSFENIKRKVIRLFRWA